MLKNIGIRIDYNKNYANKGMNEIDDISAKYSKIKVLVIPTKEELMIAKETKRLL